MTRLTLVVVLLGALVVALPFSGAVAALEGPSLAGTWSLNRGLSQFPREVGFGMDAVAPGGTGSGERADPATGESSGVMRNNLRPESEEEARNRQQLIDEVRTPSRRLIVTQSETAITITDEGGRTRTFHPDGRTEFQPLDAAPEQTVSRWEAGHLVVRYKVSQDREVRYTYSRRNDPPQLVVQVQFVERGGHDVITRVYDPTKPGEPLPAAPPPPTPTVPAWQRAVPAAAPAGVPDQQPASPSGPPRMYQPGQPLMPASPDRTTGAPLSPRPGSELKGLTSLGVVVEDLGPAAATCGLKQDVLETTVTRSLTDGGLKVVTNSDEDTYLYVHVTTTAMTTGFCFSRYDATLYTHTTATLTYGSAPALVQVELLRNGGITGGGATAHAEAVVRSLRQYVDSFVASIRAANK
jgi:hypothetical protein